MKYRLLRIALLFSLRAWSQAAPDTFTNPLLPEGADPWSIYKDGYYYYTHTTGNRLELWKTRSLAELAAAPHQTIWTPPDSGPYSKHIWAPEIHFLAGKWYAYFAADDGKNENHRLWVLENASPDPTQGTWELKGKLADRTDKWAIDGSVFEHRGKLYLVWSGWEGDTNGRQDIYIARMKNPWTLKGKRVLLSKPTYPWERDGDIPREPGSSEPAHVDVNEGPQVLRHRDRLFLVYSASGCWTGSYRLGMLTASAKGKLRKPASWRKHPEPVFQSSPADSVFAPGHNSFFKSPDGTEDWILYHANDQPNEGCDDDRSPRAQQFTWNADGTPNFGKPVPRSAVLAVPSEKQ